MRFPMRIVILILAMVFIGTFVPVGWALDQGPVLSNQTPADQSNVSTATPKIAVNIAYSSSDYDVSGATLMFDWANVTPVITGTSPNYQLSYTPPMLKDGSHTVTVSIPNVTDPTKSYSTTWAFNVKVPPVISKPSPTYTVTGGTPVLAAYATDNTGLSAATFTIDGQAVSGQIDTLYGRISAQVPQTLADGGHTVTLAVYDSMGNAATTQWQFQVDTQLGVSRPDMPVNNNVTCWTCHPKDFAFKAGTENLAGSHSAPSQCVGCHAAKDLGYLDRFRDCTTCHYGKFFTTIHPSYAPASSYRNLPNRQHPVKDIHLSSTTECTDCHSRILTQEHNRVDKNGQQITCDTCHAGSYLTKEVSTGGSLRVDAVTAKWSVGYHYLTWYTPAGVTISRIYLDRDSSLNLSDIYGLVDTSSGKQWARLNPSKSNYGPGASHMWIDLPYPAYGVQLRIYANGNDTGYVDVPKAMTSVDKTNPEYIKIQTAIANKDTKCSACHTTDNHEQVHVDGLDNNCQQCHKGTLTQEHLNNPITTANKDYTCRTCHFSTTNSVKRAIAQHNVNCGSCHKTGHTVALADTVPSDIPLYNSFSWTAPVEGTIYAGEPSSPAGFDQGLVVLSDRKTVNISDVWNYYKGQLTSNNWVLQSGAPASGASYFAAQFTKDSRQLIVRCYNTSYGDGTGPLTSGYRVEIWYK